MYAVTTIFSMDPNKKAQLVAGLDTVVIPQVRDMPGFVTGFWSWDHSTDVTYGFITFKTEAEAKGLESFLKGAAERLAAGGTRLERAVVAQVLGAAGGASTKKVDGAELWQRLLA